MVLLGGNVLIKIHVDVSDKKIPTFNYRNEVTGEIEEGLLKEKVLQLIKRDIKDGYLISYPSEEFEFDEFI